MHNNEFHLNRAYSKRELAGFYNPCITEKSAVNTLMEWIKRNNKLYDELLDTGYRVRSRIFTPLQVNIIVHYLGRP